MKASETADRCECGKALPVWDFGQCEACAREDVARRARTGIEDVQQYRRDAETEDGFIARLETKCPRCHAPLNTPGVPGKLGCPACAWTNPYTLRDSLVSGGGNVMWVHARDRVAALVGRGMKLKDAVRSVTTDMDVALANLQQHRSASANASAVIQPQNPCLAHPHFPQRKAKNHLS